MKVAQTSKVLRQHEKETVTGGAAAAAQIYFHQSRRPQVENRKTLFLRSLASLSVSLSQTRTPADVSSHPPANLQNAPNANESSW